MYAMCISPGDYHLAISPVASPIFGGSRLDEIVDRGLQGHVLQKI